MNQKRLSLTGKGLMLFIAVYMLSLYSVFSQNIKSDTITERIHSIPNVTVKAKRAPNKVTSTRPIQSFSSNEIEVYGLQSISDAVRRFAGAEVRDYGGIGGMKTVSVRNIGATHTAISYDGIAVSNCQAGQIDIGRFSLDNVESLTLSIGQSDNLLQSAKLFASAGVLNISTAKPVFRKNDYNIKAHIKTGSFSMINPYIYLAQKINKKTCLSIDADFLYSNGDYPFILKNGNYITKEKRINSDVRSWHTEANLFHSFNDNETLKIKAYYYQSDRGLPGVVVLYNPESDEHLWDINAFVQSEYYKKITEKLSINVQGKYNYSWNKYKDEGVEYANGYIEDKYRQNEYYTSACVLYSPLKVFNLAAAQDIAVNTLHSNMPECPFPIRLTSLSVIRVRYNSNWFKAEASLLNTWITESVKSGERPDDLKKLSPSLSFNLKPFSNEELYVRLMYKNTFRTPTFNDLYYYRMGNRSLNPEKAQEYNLGLTWATNSINNFINYISITADAYYNYVKDKIVAFPTTYVWKMANFGIAEIKGSDFTVSTSITPYKGYEININASYTWQSAIDKTDSKAKNYKHQLPYTPKHNGNVSTSLSLPWFTIGYSVLAVGKRYYLAQNTPDNEIEGYTDHTLSVSKNFKLKDFTIKFKGDIINLTDSQYDVIKYYPMPGRSWKITIGINF